MSEKPTFEQPNTQKSSKEKGSRAIQNLHNIIQGDESDPEFVDNSGENTSEAAEPQQTHTTERMLRDAQKTFIEESHPEKD